MNLENLEGLKNSEIIEMYDDVMYSLPYMAEGAFACVCWSQATHSQSKCVSHVNYSHGFCNVFCSNKLYWSNEYCTEQCFSRCGQGTISQWKHMATSWGCGTFGYAEATCDILR